MIILMIFTSVPYAIVFVLLSMVFVSANSKGQSGPKGAWKEHERAYKLNISESLQSLLISTYMNISTLYC